MISQPRFNTSRAWLDLNTQLEFGPRFSGTPGYENMTAWLENELSTLSDTLVIQEFTARNPFSGQTMPHRNYIARLNPGKTPRIMISAHYDTRPVADMDPDPAKRKIPIPGANDGASGVAVVMEVLRNLREYRPDIALDAAFWDAEDMGRSGRTYEFCQGSRHYARNPLKPLAAEGILLDMVADAELQFFYEQYSMQLHPELMVKLWQIAADMGYGDIFIPRMGTAVYDDHVPLSRIAGISTVDIIDFNYPNFSENYWHTHEDISENCAPESLGIVGELVLYYLLGKY